MLSFIPRLADGRIIASGQTTVVLAAAGNYAFIIRIPDFKMIEEVITYKFHSDPTVDPGTPVNEKVVGNVVGVTLIGVGAGTTLTVKAIAIGL